MTTATESIMVDLARLGVVLTVEGDRLRFRAPAGVLTAELRAAVAENRAEILVKMATDSVVSDGRTVPTRTPRCRTHLNPMDWVDHAPVRGSVRTTCRRCGTWIGNRSVEVAEAGRRKQAAKAAATIFGTSKPNPNSAEST